MVCNPFERPRAADIPHSTNPGTPRVYDKLPGKPYVRTVEFEENGVAEIRLDVRDAFVAASTWETDSAIKTQYTVLLSVLSSAYNLSSEVIPAQVGNSNPLNDPRIHTTIASFGAKKQKEARKALAIRCCHAPLY